MHRSGTAPGGAGIAYLCGGGYEAVIHTVVNALAIVSGVICDGAKASCAAKIATAVEAGLLGYNMYIRGQQFRGGDGIVAKGVENSLRNVGRLGKQGMKETNREIIDIIVGWYRFRWSPAGSMYKGTGWTGAWELFRWGFRSP